MVAMRGAFLLITLCSVASFAQTAQQEINEQLWKPYLKASSEFDGAAFMAAHSRSLVQASLESKRVLDYDQHEASILPGFARIRGEGKITRTTEMRFTARIASGEVAYERGYFKSTTRRANGETRIGYAEFYMVLRKEKGVWKIFVDADSSLNGTITEDLYLAAQPLE